MNFNNKGNSLIILFIPITLILAVVGAYFYFQNTKPTSEKPQAIIQKNPEVLDRGDYFEIIDKNSSNHFSIKFPKNVEIDTTFQYPSDAIVSTKKLTQNATFKFNEYPSDLYEISLTPKLLIPEVTGKFGGCSNYFGVSASNSTFDKNKYIKLNEELKTNNQITEMEINSFKAYYYEGIPDSGNGGIETSIIIDSNYILKINYFCFGPKKDSSNEKLIELYDQIVKSVIRIN